MIPLGNRQNYISRKKFMLHKTKDFQDQFVAVAFNNVLVKFFIGTVQEKTFAS